MDNDDGIITRSKSNKLKRKNENKIDDKIKKKSKNEKDSDIINENCNKMIIDIKNKDEELHVEIPENIMNVIGNIVEKTISKNNMLETEVNFNNNNNMNNLINNIVSKYYNGEYDEEEYIDGEEEEYIDGEEEEYEEEAEEEAEEEEEEEDEEEDKEKNKNDKLFNDFPILKLDGNPMFLRKRSNSLDSKYVKYLSTISKSEKNKLLKIEDDIMKEDESIIPLKARILTSSMNNVSKKIILEKIQIIDTLDPSTSEYSKLKKYMDGIQKLPFGIYNNLPVSIKSKKKEIVNFLHNVYNKMNKSVYGHQSAKSKIMNTVCQWITNPNSMSQILAIQGPPGIGKTSLVKDGVADALGLPFSFISLGGATDASFLEGHSYTYEGSTWGKIVSILMDSKCMNPVIYMDELDKISETTSGQEIVNILTHLIDQTQNTEFHDKYYTGIDFDLSRALFVFSLNDETKINPILRDRLKIVRLDGFTKEDKIVIIKEYIIPKIYKNVGIEQKDIVISDEIINFMIERSDEEKGVRSVKKNIEQIILNINTARLLSLHKKRGELTEIYNKLGLSNIKYPFIVTKEISEKLVKQEMKNTIQFSKMTKKNKNLILDRVHQMEVTEPASSEFYKMKQYMEGIYKIPFGIYKNLSITNKSSKIEITNFLENIQKQLDKSIYGHNKAKIDILNVVSQWINNPESSCPIIGIQGAPGIGKTCLIKEGISKALNIPFASLPLGGISDGSHLVGHSYTYIGSKWGRIIEILMTTKCMNPIIYFDELDKISTSEKGEEINGILTHLTDQTQNNEFHDKYYEGIDFDLSKAFFIFSFNNEHQINPILRDRIKIIHLDGFNKKDKIKISRDYILKDILKNIGMVKEDVVITDEIWNYFVETYDGKEKGVRTLKKNLEHILMNLNTIKLLSLEKETNEITKDNSLYKMYKDLKDIKFPFTLTKEIIQKLLKEKNVDKAPLSLYI